MKLQTLRVKKAKSGKFSFPDFAFLVDVFHWFFIAKMGKNGVYPVYRPAYRSSAPSPSNSRTRFSSRARDCVSRFT